MHEYSFSDLKNKTAVVTGGSGVIGLSIVKALSECGVKTAIITRNKKNTEEKISSLKNTIAVEGNVVDKNSLLKAKEEINNSFGKINILINCAGGNYPDATTKIEFLKDEKEKFNSISGLDTEAINKVFQLNFLGTLLPVQVFSEDMIENKNGVVLNISSISSFRPLTKVAAYSASKAAINNFTQWLSIHFAEMNIRVNAVAPGFILAEQNRFLLIDKETGNLTERGNKIISSTPLKRFVEPEEICGAVLFLISDISKAVTGTVLPVDGGFNAYSGV